MEMRKKGDCKLQQHKVVKEPKVISSCKMPLVPPGGLNQMAAREKPGMNNSVSRRGARDLQ